MVFSSSLFLLYFLPIFLLVYFVLPSRFRNYFALLASVLFYAWGAPKFIFIVLGSIVADFFVVKKMNTQIGRIKNVYAAVSVVLNLGLLLYFKYANFFVENFNALLSGFGVTSLSWTEVALPIGISFFTFQKLTYTVDVYRKMHAPLKKLSDYALYILMFPQLIAGPIVRFNEIADQIEDRRSNESYENRISGFFRFTVGLAKKVLIANTLGAHVDMVFASDFSSMSSSSAWIGIIAYAFQIYYDFSGYSDMAIGLGRMIGFDFPENFNNPYISQSISEFWRRWHITLGRFMKDYLYIPLGGNRVTVARMYFNLWFVFLISGFWHGAAWTFIIWGAFHGFFLIADRLFLLKFYSRIGKIPGIFITFVITLIGWVFFRADSLADALLYIERMFDFSTFSLSFTYSSKFVTIILIAAFFAFVAALPGIEAFQVRLFSKVTNTKTLLLYTTVALLLFVVSLSFITSSGFNPFIYFRF